MEDSRPRLSPEQAGKPAPPAFSCLMGGPTAHERLHREKIKFIMKLPIFNLIPGISEAPMETIPLDKGSERQSSSGRIITREEYDALMSEAFSMEAGLEDAEKPGQIEARVRKLEYCLLILVGYVLIFFTLSRTG
jgi:hypothetical protein